MNRNFGKIIENGAAVEFAPDFLAPNPAVPTEAEYLAAGWLKTAIVPPSPTEGEYCTATRYEVVEGQICAVYEYAPIPAPVRTFSVARLIYWVTERGTYDALKAALGESMLMQAVALGEFAEDNEDFVELRPQIEAVLGAEAVAAALDYAEVE